MNDIVKTIKTQKQLDDFTHLLDILGASLYKNTDAFEKALTKDKSTTAQLLVSELSKPEVVNSPQQKQRLLDDLGAELKTLKTVHLTIAIPVSEDIVRLVSSWAEKKLKGNYLFDIQYDPTIIGGAQISFEGRYMDDSLIRRIEEVFKKDEQQIIQLVEGAPNENV